MSSDLLAKFLAGVPARLMEMGEDIASLEVDTSAKHLRKISRDLHTIKGEARLVGMVPVEHLAHAAEDVLAAHQQRGTLDITTQKLLYEALDTIFSCVGAAQSQEPAADDLITATLRKLQEASQIAASPAHSIAEAVVQTPVAAKATPGKAERGFAAVNARQLEKINYLTALTAGALIRNRTAVEQLWQDIKKLRSLAAEDVVTVAGRGLITSLLQQTRHLRERMAGDEAPCTDLKQAVRSALLRPLSETLAAYPTFARQIAQGIGKSVSVEMHNTDLQLEDRVLQEIAEPSLHLLRNAIAHGIEYPEERRQVGKSETGKIIITASQEGEALRISFTDDGCGLQVDKIVQRALELGLTSPEAVAAMDERARIALVFQSGLSTAPEVTELAGRGVGLDVVANVVQRIGGSVEVTSQLGLGTTFSLRVPIATSLTRAMLLESCGQKFAIANTYIGEVFWISTKEIRVQVGGESVVYRGSLLPLTRLRTALGLQGFKDLFVNKVVIVVLHLGDRSIGVVVDQCLGERELMMHSFGSLLGRPRPTGGLAVLEDDSIVVILQPNELAEMELNRISATSSTEPSEKKQTGHILYAEDSVITREYTANLLRSHGFIVTEVGDGSEALTALNHGRFDLLLTDLQMPNVDGFKLIAAVRRGDKARNIPIIIMSTVDSADTKSMALQTGADAYIVKAQFTLETILSTIAQVMK